jgi:cyclic-di-GMP-binding protein
MHMEHGKSFGGTMELAVFGRMRNEPDRRLELARRRFATFAAPGGPWEVKDVSQTGFRLLAPMSVANAVTLGTLAAIRPHGQTPWTLGIVRRMRKMTADRAEIGLQVIANSLIGVDLVEQRKRGESDYSVDGEAVTINGRTFHGLFLTLKKREADAAVQSLIVPAAEYQPNKRLKLMTSKSTNPIRFGRLLEQQPDWVWATVEQPLELTQPMPSSNTVTRTMIPPAAANE